MNSMKQKEQAAFSGGQALYAVSYPAIQAKQLGRTAFHSDSGTLWCSLSGTGIAFFFSGRECCLKLTADSAYSGGIVSAVRYAVFVNDVLVKDAQLTEQEQTVRLQNPAGEAAPAEVRLVKLSEAAHSSLGIREIRIVSAQQGQTDLIVPAPKKKHLIEFIGDSITCGYGVDGVLGKDIFQTANENVLKSYAYVTAERLDADYSMVCYSGYGIVSGYTETGQAVRHELVPRFYGMTGYSKAVIEVNRRIQDDLWDFAEQPELVVINLGTNDASYTGNDPEKQLEFAAGYTAFLKTVRAKNPEAAILCTLGIMDQILCNAVSLAVSAYSKETGDSYIRTMRFDMQNEQDGYGVDWHPSAVTHEKAAAKLCAEIRAWLDWTETGGNHER